MMIIPQLLLIAITLAAKGGTFPEGRRIDSATYNISPTKDEIFPSNVFPPADDSIVGKNLIRINRSPQVDILLSGPNAFIADRRRGFVTIGSVSFGGFRNNIEDILSDEWTKFKIAFNKTYSTPEEDIYRREIFIENRDKISRFNQEYGFGAHSFVQKLNEYSDLLNHEFNRLVNGISRTRKEDARILRPSTYISSANVPLPSYVDWREAGAVTSVKRQGHCGACYAFSAAGALEGQYFRKTGRLVDLSPQNLVDCSQPYSNEGCLGGSMDNAFQYIWDNQGIDKEEAYPFEEREGECRYKEEGYGAHNTGYVRIRQNDEAALEVAVATVGPISVAIDSSHASFQQYSNGIYFEPLCGNTIDSITHGVLVVGYGTEPNGQQYWLIKNSYGPEWGIGGYMKLAKNANNHCAVASLAVYPLV